MKLTTIWENFDEFKEIIRRSGTSESIRHIVEIEKMIPNDIDWKVIWYKLRQILIKDKRIFKYFDYPEEKKDIIRETVSNEILMMEIFDKMMKTQVYNGIKWGSPVKPNQSFDILLDGTKPATLHLFTDGYLFIDDKKYSVHMLTHGTHKVFIHIHNGEYTFSTSGDKRVNLGRKYPEVIYLCLGVAHNLNFLTFQRLVRCYLNVKNFKIPTLSGTELQSHYASSYISNIKDSVDEWLEIVNSDNRNILNTYGLENHGLIVERKEDAEKLKNISDFVNDPKYKKTWKR